MNLGLSALLAKKFFPGKATFERAIFAGMCGIATTAAVGYSAVMLEKFRNAMNAEGEMLQLRGKIARLKARIVELTDLLESCGTGQNCSASLEFVKNELVELRQRGAWLEKEMAAWMEKLEMAEEDMLLESRKYEKLVEELQPAAKTEVSKSAENRKAA